MGYMLIEEPHGEESKRAFSALDDAYGTDEFTEAEAKQVLVEHGFDNNMWSALVTAGCVSEA